MPDLICLVLTGIALVSGPCVPPGSVKTKATWPGMGDKVPSALGIQLGTSAGDMPCAEVSLIGTRPAARGTS